MKLYIKTLLIGIGIFIASCNPDLVDEPTLGNTEADFFTNVVEFRQVVAGAYAAYYDYYHFAAPSFNWNGWAQATWLLPGDDITETQAARTAVELFDGSLNPNYTQIRWIYQVSYKMIGRANVVIDKVNTIEFSEYEGAAEIEDMEGEALFLRGYAYYKLFNTYGSVPIVTDRILSEDRTNTAKSPASEVLDQVIADMKAALEILPESWDSQYAGRVTKNSARGFLVKALVMKGNYYGDDAAYSEALTYFDQITASLTDNFIDNFNAETENNEESLFEIQAAAPGSGNNNLFLHNDGAWRGVENLSVFRGYYIQPGTGRGFTESVATWFLVTDKLYDNFGDDPRISIFLVPDDGFEGQLFQKYHIPLGVDELTGFHGGSANNERILRYSDVILLAAEAALKTGSPQRAVELINEVRTRARDWALTEGIGDGSEPADYSTSETNTSTIMQWIMDERFVELAGEGQRWYDLKRWHEAGDIDLTGWDGSDDNFSTNLVSPVQFDVSKHLVFPLPQEVLDRNSAITENNPGY